MLLMVCFMAITGKIAVLCASTSKDVMEECKPLELGAFNIVIICI